MRARRGGAGSISVVRIPAGRGPYAGAGKTAADQEIGGLAALGDIVKLGPETAADQIAGVLGPIALEGVHGTGDGLAVEPVRRQLGADAKRPVAAGSPGADDASREALVVLP